MVHYSCSRSFRVIEVGTQSKARPVCDFILVFQCNYKLIPIFYRFRDISSNLHMGRHVTPINVKFGIGYREELRSPCQISHLLVQQCGNTALETVKKIRILPTNEYSWHVRIIFVSVSYAEYTHYARYYITSISFTAVCFFVYRSIAKHGLSRRRNVCPCVCPSQSDTVSKQNKN